MSKITVQDILDRKKANGPKITALAAYDYPFAKLVDECGIDIVIVGDSLGMVCLGYPSTVSVALDDMIHHGCAVSRAVSRALKVVDMPFRSYDDPQKAVINAKRLVEEAGADAVKVEGGEKIYDSVQALVQNKIAVMGHLGVTPQSVEETGGYKVRGKTKLEAEQMMRAALALEKRGVFSIVLECVPYALAETLTKSLHVPTIGIGAGPYTDGQVLVLHDLLGFESSVRPKFVRHYDRFSGRTKEAIQKYKEDVLAGTFPSLQESFKS